MGQSSVSWRSNSSQISQKSLGGTALPRKKKTKNLLEKSSSVFLQPGRHSVEDEVDGLVEDAGGLVELQLGLQVVVLTLHVHDHGVQELDLNKDVI